MRWWMLYRVERTGSFHFTIVDLRSISDRSPCSHFLTITPGPHLMSDIILTSPILRDPSEAAPPGAAPNETYEFGFDPSSDPELAMVRQFCNPFHAIDAKSIGRRFVCQRRKSKRAN